jgi:hypothetical protein
MVGGEAGGLGSSWLAFSGAAVDCRQVGQGLRLEADRVANGHH